MCSFNTYNRISTWKFNKNRVQLNLWSHDFGSTNFYSILTIAYLPENSTKNRVQSNPWFQDFTSASFYSILRIAYLPENSKKKKKESTIKPLISCFQSTSSNEIWLIFPFHVSNRNVITNNRPEINVIEISYKPISRNNLINRMQNPNFCITHQYININPTGYS